MKTPPHEICSQIWQSFVVCLYKPSNFSKQLHTTIFEILSRHFQGERKNQDSRALLPLLQDLGLFFFFQPSYSILFLSTSQLFIPKKLLMLIWALNVFLFWQNGIIIASAIHELRRPGVVEVFPLQLLRWLLLALSSNGTFSKNLCVLSQHCVRQTHTYRYTSLR